MTWHPRKRVLVPVDFSEPTARAIQTAREFVEQDGDVHVLYVLTPLDNTSPGVLLGSVDDESRTEAAQKYVDEFLSSHQVEGATTVIRIGDPGLTIADYVASEDVDLIVMPSHGRHGISRILLGSVAERVLRHAECPVLVLRCEQSD